MHGVCYSPSKRTLCAPVLELGDLRVGAVQRRLHKVGKGARALGDGGRKGGLRARAHAGQLRHQLQAVEVHVGAAGNGDRARALRVSRRVSRVACQGLGLVSGFHAVLLHIARFERQTLKHDAASCWLTGGACGGARLICASHLYLNHGLQAALCAGTGHRYSLCLLLAAEIGTCKPWRRR